MVFNDEQYKTLELATPHFESARHDYIQNAPRWLSEKVVAIYEAATGRTIMHKNLSCAVCVLRIYQTVGKAFYADKAEREAEQQASEESISKKIRKSIKKIINVK